MLARTRRLFAPGLTRSGASSSPPDIGWSSFYLADTFNQADNSTISTSWAPTYGSTSLTVAGTPKYRTGQAIFGGKPYVEWGATTDGFYGALGTLAQPFVLVTFDLLTGVPGSSALLIDSYTDGTLPANRVFWQYQDTTIDQSRLSAGTDVKDAWSEIGFNTETLWEGTLNGASSSQKGNGTTLSSGNAGSNSMDGLALIGFNATAGCETRRCAYVGRISKANWDAGRAAWISWHNAKYGEAAT